MRQRTKFFCGRNFLAALGDAGFRSYPSGPFGAGQQIRPVRAFLLAQLGIACGQAAVPEASCFARAYGRRPEASPQAGANRCAVPAWVPFGNRQIRYARWATANSERHPRSALGDSLGQPVGLECRHPAEAWCLASGGRAWYFGPADKSSGPKALVSPSAAWKRLDWVRLPEASFRCRASAVHYFVGGAEAD
ncbi:MAG: hypothetical protein MJA83_15110, partial [Gammaproteobacteria bacterium]|nr:hypothetical protein [Gammaproteobacteria bacterium]